MDTNKDFRDRVQDLFPITRAASPVNEQVDDGRNELRNKIQESIPLSESEQPSEDVQQKETTPMKFPTDLPERTYDDDSDRDKIRENVSNAVSDKKLEDMLSHLFK